MNFKYKFYISGLSYGDTSSPVVLGELVSNFKHPVLRKQVKLIRTVDNNHYFVVDDNNTIYTVHGIETYATKKITLENVKVKVVKYQLIYCNNNNGFESIGFFESEMEAKKSIPFGLEEFYFVREIEFDNLVSK